MNNITAVRRMVTALPDQGPMVFTVVVTVKETSTDAELNAARMESAKRILSDVRFDQIYLTLLEREESLWQDEHEGIHARAFFS